MKVHIQVSHYWPWESQDVIFPASWGPGADYNQSEGFSWTGAFLCSASGCGSTSPLWFDHETAVQANHRHLSCRVIWEPAKCLPFGWNRAEAGFCRNTSDALISPEYSETAQSGHQLWAAWKSGPQHPLLLLCHSCPQRREKLPTHSSCQENYVR